jgi:hypothetical protein
VDIGSSIGIASANNRNTRLKIARSTIGIRGFTESRAVQAAALTRALDCLKGTGLGPNKGVFFILFINIYFPMQMLISILKQNQLVQSAGKRMQQHRRGDPSSIPWNPV